VLRYDVTGQDVVPKLELDFGTWAYLISEMILLKLKPSLKSNINEL